MILAPGGVELHGIVRDLAGGVIEAAQVLVASTGHSAPYHHRPEAVARTDADGRFSVWGAPGGQYVSAWADGYSTASQAGVAPNYTFELFLSPESVLAGVVVDAETREPIAGATVMSGNPFFWGGGTRTVTDGDGRFRIDGL